MNTTRTRTSLVRRTVPESAAIAIVDRVIGPLIDDEDGNRVFTYVLTQQDHLLDGHRPIGKPNGNDIFSVCAFLGPNIDLVVQYSRRSSTPSTNPLRT